MDMLKKGSEEHAVSSELVAMHCIFDPFDNIKILFSTCQLPMNLTII